MKVLVMIDKKIATKMNLRALKSDYMIQKRKLYSVLSIINVLIEDFATAEQSREKACPLNTLSLRLIKEILHNDRSR